MVGVPNNGLRYLGYSHKERCKVAVSTSTTTPMASQRGVVISEMNLGESTHLRQLMNFVKANSKTLSPSRQLWLRKYSVSHHRLPHGVAAWKDNRIIAFVGLFEDALPINGSLQPIAWIPDWQASEEYPGVGAAVLGFAVRRYNDVMFMALGGRRPARAVLEALGWKVGAWLDHFELSLSAAHLIRSTLTAVRMRHASELPDLFRGWWMNRGLPGSPDESSARSVMISPGRAELSDRVHAAAWSAFPAGTRGFRRDLERYRHQYFGGDKKPFFVSTPEVDGQPVGFLLWCCRPLGQFRAFCLIDWLGSLDLPVLQGVLRSVVELARQLGCDVVRAAASEGPWHRVILRARFRRVGRFNLYIERGVASQLPPLDGIYLTEHDADLSYTYLKILYGC